MDTVADLHLSLPASLAARLARMARERGVKRAQLLREVLEEFVRCEDRGRVEQEMAAYAEAMAPDSREFVRETARHSAQRLLKETEW